MRGLQHRFRDLSCSYDSAFRSICMDCYQPLLSNTADGLHTMQTSHRCSVADLAIVRQFPDAEPAADGLYLES